MKNNYFILTILYLGFIIGACNPPKSNGYEDADKFFSQPRFNGSFFKTFDLHEADTIIAHIRAEVPAKWQGLACQGGFYNVQGLPDVTDSMQFRYLDAIEKAFPADSTLAFIYLVRGELFTKLVRYDTATACLKRAYDLCVRNNDPVLAAGVVNGFALLALRHNDYPEATKLYLRNYAYLSTLDTTADRGRMFDIIKRLGRAYTKSQNLNEAHKWYLKAWDFAMTGPTTRRFYYATESATLLAQSYVALKQWDSAQILLDTAAYAQKTFGKTYDESLQMLLRGKVQLGKGDCKTALPLLQLAKEMVKKTSDRLKPPVYDKALADGYACLGRLDSAIYFYKMALLIPDSLQQVPILEALSKTYMQKGDYKQAYVYEQESQALRNRIFTNEKEQAIGWVHAKVDLEQREQQLIAEKNRSRLNRLLMIGALGILGLGLVWVLVRYRRKQQELQLAAEEKSLLEQQKQLVEAEALLIEQGLQQATAELTIKNTELEETKQLLDLKNSLIEGLQMNLSHNVEQESALVTAKLKNLRLLTTDDWRTFRDLFEKRYPKFFAHLNQHYPKLSVAETRLFLLIKLGFDSNEMADVLGISGTSVYVARSRLRQRLSLGKEADLEKFIQQF
ncbi:MAG: hypothetical protein JNL70_23390 [Saprospiraceae bacterium]|nr:hypothetical protein [Saprospiraceae bacterium]